MDRTHLRGGVAVALLLAAPAVAQEPGFAFGPTLPPIAPTAVAPVRPGLFGWRQRHAERKRHLQEKFLGYPEEFHERPLGSSLYAHGRTQVANGEAARMIFNHYDFVGETDALNERGRDKLTVITARLPASFDPVIVERTPWEPGLAEVRRLALLGRFAAGPFPVPADRVVVGRPVASPLGGVEARIVNANRLGQAAAAGAAGVGGPGTIVNDASELGASAFPIR